MATTRNDTVPVFVLLFLILAVAEVASEPPDMVPLACTDAYAAGRQLTTVDFCLSVLEGHNSAGAADYSDLALIAVGLTTANATATKTKLDALVAGGVGNNAALLYGLRSCQGLYDAVVRMYQPDCYAAVRDRRYGDARKCLGRTAEAAGVCERWFPQRKMASPVAQDDDNLAKLANVAIALTLVS